MPDFTNPRPRSQRASIRSLFLILAVGALGLAPLACSRGGGGSGGIPSQLAVLGLDVDGETAVKRNQPITLTLTGPVDPGSLGVGSLLVTSPSGGVHQGRAVLVGDRITFHPTSWDGVDDRGVDQRINHFVPAPSFENNGVGFLPGARYEVRLPGRNPQSLRGLNGRPLESTFVGSFTTADDFLSEPNPVPPRLRSVMEFNQQPVNADCNPDPIAGFASVSCPNGAGSVPVPLLDPSNVQFSFVFSEPVNLEKIGREETITLRNVSVSPPREISGVVTASGDLRELRFRPLSSLGDDPDSDRPYLFEARLTERLEDLAGNGLVHDPVVTRDQGPVVLPLRFRFETLDKPGEINTSAVVESFVDAEFRDDLGTTAVWEGGGTIAGAPIVLREVEVAPTTTNFNLPHPLDPRGFRILHLIQRQLIRAGDDRDGRESIVGVSWGPKSNFVFASDYPDVTIRIGHTNVTGAPGSQGLAFNYSQNYSGFPDNPRGVYRGPYRTENSLTSVYFPWPNFQTDFEYDGQSGVVLDYDVAPGGDTFQLFRNASSAMIPRFRVFGPAGAQRAGMNVGGLPPGGLEIYHHRIRMLLKKSIATSRPYDTGVGSPDYVRAQIITESDRPGTRLRIRFVGYDELRGGPDLDNPFGPVDDIDQIDGRRFVSFILELDADPFSGNTPQVEAVVILYQSP